MNNKRMKELYGDFKNALERLARALKEDINKNETAVDGTIQRFEFTFELAWKLESAILSYNGVEVGIPRMVIKEAFKAGLLKDGAAWIEMLEDRNKTSHIYDEDMAQEIYNKIKNSHFKILEDFRQSVEDFIKSSGI